MEFLLRGGVLLAGGTPRPAMAEELYARVFGDPRTLVCGLYAPRLDWSTDFE
jgi:hypothetical protein